MTIDWLSFTPFSALVGGALIGLSAGLLMLGQGRVLGASGILTFALLERTPWRLVLLSSMFAVSVILIYFTDFGSEIQFVSSSWRFYIGAFLVGLGAQLGSGCTSGHGICGLARLSKRSFVSVGIFMSVAILTVFIFGTGFDQ